MIRVGVVRGGISHKYPESLETGAVVLDILRNHYPASYKAIDILITRDGMWHIAGRPVHAQQLAESVDVIWNGLHGEYGEDGALQAELEALGIPYTGSGPMASLFGFNPKLAQQTIRELGLHFMQEHLVQDFRTVDIDQEGYFHAEVDRVFATFAPPWTVVTQNGTEVLAKTRAELFGALLLASELPGSIYVREYVKGKHATVLIADAFRGRDVYAFIPRGEGLSFEEKKSLETYALSLYGELGMRHYAQIEFIVTPKKTYVSKIAVVPEIRRESHIHHALQEVGTYLPEFIDHIIQLAVKR